MRAMLALALLSLAPSLAVAATPPVTGACAAAIATADRGSPVPLPLMRAIGIVETGRPDPGTRTIEPWPWSVNVGGEGRFYDSKADAIAAVRALQASGVSSIDVGCMQVNLFYHPHAFASLDAAFDPLANARYAARFLAALYRQDGTWPAAAAAYHSQTPALGAAYAERVLAAWPGSGYAAPLGAGRPTPLRFTPLRFPNGRIAVSLDGAAPMRILSLDQIIGRAPERPPVPHG
ncbi:MAG TPA: transglycosylase SLT domain-containing protein [Acetobacteraceae bacterium]|nr:transglycosylase SLT domain-containing protein [Acetobacteraceae bacterium]